jgi:TP901 family phage tail tape measure protein
MADIQANIGINLDTTRALAQLKNLQRQISVFNAEMVRGGGKSAVAAASFQQELVNSINATGQFSASLTKVSSTTEAFTNALEKNKLSMGQTFRYAGAASKKFSHLFTNEFNTIEKVARERVKTIQTQYIKMGRDANGAIRAIAVRPLALDMNNLATQTAMAAQKQQILNQLLRQGSTNLLNWGKNTQWAGRQLMVGFTIPLALFGSAASKSFMELEEQAIRFKRVYGDLFTTPQQADQAFADMKRLGEEFTRYGVAVEKTIGLAASVAQMGKTGADLTAQVTEATRLAVLGGMEQEDALNTTISLTNAFGVAAEDLTDKINFLNAAENQTILSIQDFNEAVPRAGSVVAQLGGDVEDLAFFLTAMREGGIEASQGANALKTSLGRLVNPTRRAREELLAYGIDVVGIVERNAGNLRETVLQLGSALDQLDPLEKSRAIERLFGKFQFARMSALFNNIMDEGSQAAAVLDLINSSASDLSTIANRELGRVEQSAATQFRSAVEQFQAALAPIGESFLKLVTPIIEFGTKVLKAFNNLNDGTKSFIVGLVAVVGAIGPVLLMGVGLLANGIANLLKMFLGLQTVFQRIRSGAKGVGDQTDYMTQQQLEAAAAADSLGQKHSNLRQIFTSEKVAIDNLVAAYTKMTTAQRNSLGIPQMVRTTSTAVPGFAKGRKVPGYKDGVVMVPGPKGAGDIQPAMLAPGEAVIPAEMAEKYGPLINAMIAGNIPGYMAGRTSTKTTMDAAHFAGEDIRDLSAKVMRLAEAGEYVETTVYRMTETADGLGRVFERITGYLHELIQEGDVLTAAGRTYGGTTIPATSERNQGMNKAFGFSGEWGTTEELFEQERVLLAAKAENSEAYRNHTAAIEQLLLEAQESRSLISQSNDQDAARLAIETERAKLAVKQKLMAYDGLSADEAEEKATRLVAEAEELYRKETLKGVSSEKALQAASDRLAKIRLSLVDAYFAAPAGTPTDSLRSPATGRSIHPSDPVRQRRRAAGLSVSAPDYVQHVDAEGKPRTGQLFPSAGLSMAKVMEAAGPEFDVAGKELIERAAHRLAKAVRDASRSQSPSKEMERVGGDLARGAIVGVEAFEDEARVAGQSLAQETVVGFNNFPAEGETPGTRGGRGRFRTAGDFTTPGQPIAFGIAGGKEIQAAQKQLAVSTRVSSINVANLAASAIDGANKIGTLGIGISSLAGGLSMIEGPIGEFASKLFPVTSVITGLTFAMNFLNAETVKTTLTTKLARVEAVKRIRLGNIANASQARLNASTNALAGATVRLTTAMNIAAVRTGAGVKGIGAVVQALTGVGGKAGLVIAALALVAGGIYLLNRVIQDQKARIEGLGDAANMSADRLKGLADALGISGSGAREATIASAQSSAVTGTLEEQKEIVNTRDQFLELIETNDEFKKEWKGTVAALKGGTDEMAQATLEMLAVTLQTEGYSEEQIAGIVQALKDLAGKTNVDIDFASINIETQTGAIDAAAQNFVDTVTSTVNASTGQIDYFKGIGSEAALDALSASLASAIINANAQFDAGIITLEQYEAQLEKIRSTLAAIGEEKGLGPQTEAVKAFIEELEAMGFEGIAEDTAGLIESGTSRGLDAAAAVAQARAAGEPVSETEIASLEVGAQEGASERAISNTLRSIDAIKERTAARKEDNAELARQAEINNQIQNLPSDIERETEAIQEQTDVFNDAYDAAKANVEIKNDLALAEKIAGDEVLRAAFLEAQRNGTTEEFLSSLDEQISLQNQLKAAQDLAGLQAQVEQQREQKIITDGLSTALGDSALAQEMMNNAQYAGIISSALLKAGFDAATGSAEDLAEAMSSEEVLSAVAIIKEAMSLAGTAPRSGGGGTPKSFLDDIVKGLRDTANAQTRVTEGFNASLRAITAFSKAGVAGLNGLSSQLRRAGASEPFIDLILGMDPKDWEREKRRLFNFNADGTVADLTAAGRAVQDAINTAEIGKFINEQDRLTVSVGNQIDAITKLTSAGASYEAAYEAVQNTAFATAVATATSAAQITAAAEAAMSAMRKMQELQEINEEEERKKRISEAIREQNKEFSNQAKILDYITNNRSKLSEAQMSAILNNKDLQSLVLEPSIDPRALAIALNNAQEQADLELRIKKLTTEGQEDIFQEGVSNAMSAFGALEREIELEFQAKIKDDGSLVQDAERQIALIDFELDDYQAGLDEIDRLEQDINDVYDKRIEALDKVAELNDDIARSQEAQLDIADALSQGDIAAAARAVQQSRQIEQENAREAQTRMLEQQRAAEVAALRSSSGLSREQLQDRVKDLEEQIFNIEERTLEPAQERIRLAELTRDDQIASLEVLNRTREEWDRISNSVDVAQANGWRFADSMQESLNIVEKLIDSLTNRPLPPPPVNVPAPAAPAKSSSPAPTPAPAPAPKATSGGSSSSLPPGRTYEQQATMSSPGWNPPMAPTYHPNQSAPSTLQMAMGMSKPASVPKTTTTTKFDSSYGGNVPKGTTLRALMRAYGGIVGRARSGPPQQFFDGGRVKGPGTERSDSIPAMLSNGEYVVQARAVRQIGTAFLDMLNGGKVVPQNKDGIPAFRTGGYVNTNTLAGILKASKPAPKKYTPPVSIRQAERAASKPSLPKAPLISAGKNPPPPVQTRRPSTASASRTTAPAPAPRPAPTPAVMTQDTRTPLKKALDNLSNTLRTSGITNYLPNPVEIIKNIGEFILPVTASQVGSDGPSSVAPIRRGATTNSLVDDLLGMPFAGDIALYGTGALLAKPIVSAVGAVGNALKVPTVRVPGSVGGSSRAGTSLGSPPGRSSLPGTSGPSRTNATTQAEIVREQRAIAENTQQIIEQKLSEGIMSGAIRRAEDVNLIREYGRALARSDRNSSGPALTPPKDFYDSTIHISDLTPEQLSFTAQAHRYMMENPNANSLLNTNVPNAISPLKVRTDNKRIYIKEVNPLRQFLTERGVLKPSLQKQDIEEELRLMNLYAKDSEVGKIAQQYLIPQVGPIPSVYLQSSIFGKRSTTSFASSSDSLFPLNKTSGVKGVDSGLPNYLFNLLKMDKKNPVGPFSTYMAKDVPRQNQSQRTREVFFHENAHRVDNFRRLTGQSPIFSSPGTSNASTEATAMAAEAIRNRARGGPGISSSYNNRMIEELDELVNNLRYRGTTEKANSSFNNFIKEYIEGPRRFQFGADWLEEYLETIARAQRGVGLPIHASGDLANLQKAANRLGEFRVSASGDYHNARVGLTNLLKKESKIIGDPFVSVSGSIKPRKSLWDSNLDLSPSPAPRQSSTFLDKESLKDIDIPLDTEFHAGVYTKQSSFVEDLSGNKYFVKEHLGTYLDDPGSIKSSFSNEFLAGRIGNQIGANTPQSYIIRRGPNHVPFEIATGSIPSSMGMAPEKMQRLIQSSPDPIKTLEDLLEAYAKYNKATPALNAVFHNTDLHRNNVMWDNLNKRLMQIDFGQSAPYNLRHPEGSAAALKGREHYKLPEAIQSSTQSMATVRAAINDAINEAIDLGFLNRPAQLELAQRARSLGFGVSPNTNDINPLKDVFKTAHVSTDLTDAYTKIANLDMKNLPSQVAKDLGAKTTFLHDITEFKIDEIKDRALVLLNTGRAARISIGEADKEGALFSRQLRMDSNESSFYRMGGIVKSINSDNVPAMLTAGEYVVRRSAVQSFGADNLEKINNGTYNNGSVYNYNLEVNVKSDADPNRIARTVMTQIKQVENQRIRSNRI